MCTVSTCLQCIQRLASATLGSILGTYTLSSLLSARWHLTTETMMISVLCREEIASTVLEVFGVACDPWGIVVERVEVNREPSRDEHSSCQREVSQCQERAHNAFTNNNLL